MLSDAELQALIDDVESDFPSYSSYAKLYRHYGMQVVPANFPNEVKEWKRPHYELKWKQYQKTMMEDQEFDALYGLGAKYAGRQNMGLITGVSPRRIVVVDLDAHKNPKAEIWWQGIHADHNMGIMSHTVAQRTGGGGEQHFFIAPDGFICPTNRNSSWGVDSRGDGGFAMLAPSKHESGKLYEWMEGQAPWECDFEVMPEWMCREIESILGVGISHRDSGSRTRTDTPAHRSDEWGKIVDGREDLMTKMVFRSVLGLYRDCPIMPSDREQADAMENCFQSYVMAVDTRIEGSTKSKEDLLEQEGRGRSLFIKKWRATILQWDEKISKEAARPFVKETPEKIDPFSEPPPSAGSKEEKKEEEPSTKEEEKPETDDDEFAPKKKKLLKLYTIDEIESFGPVKALIEDTVAEGSLGFIYGPPGCGKTFVALSMGLSIAYGREHWLWDKRINRGGPVIYISLEGKSDLGNRIKAWKIHNGISHNDQNFRAIFDQVNFTRQESIKIFVDSLDEYMSAYSPPSMIFIDTVSRSIAGGGENDAEEISLFIETCGNLQRRYSTNLTGIHHTGRFGTNMRGSSAFDGGADFMYRVERDKKAGLSGLIHAEKIKAYPDMWEMPFRLEKITLDDFGAQSSLVATSEPEQAPAGGSGASEGGFGGHQETGFTTIGRKLPDAVWKAIFDEVDQAKQEGIPWSEFKQSGSRYAGTRIMEIIYSHGIDTMNESDADAIVRKLTGKLYLVTVEYMHNKMLKKGLEVRNRPSFNV